MIRAINTDVVLAVSKMTDIDADEVWTAVSAGKYFRLIWQFMKSPLSCVHQKPKHVVRCMHLQVATRPPSSPGEVNGPHGMHGMSLIRLPMS